MNMVPEIIDAITTTYMEHPEVELDCMLFLRKRLKGLRGSDILDKWFDSKGRCRKCGSEFVIYEYREVHTELDGNPVEILNEEICPVCERM